MSSVEQIENDYDPLGQIASRYCEELVLEAVETQLPIALEALAMIIFEAGLELAMRHPDYARRILDRHYEIYPDSEGEEKVSAAYDSFPRDFPY